MKTLKNWTLAGQHPDRIELTVDEQHSFCLYVLEPHLCRVLIKQHHALRLERSWSIAPDQDAFGARRCRSQARNSGNSDRAMVP